MLPACSEGCTMMLLCWFTLSLWFSANAAEFSAVWRDSGESVALQCFSAGCSSSTGGYDGMYLYLNQDHKERKEVLYYHPYPGSAGKITPGLKFTGRIETSGSLENNTVTIRNLSVDDSGFYSCVFFRFSESEFECSVHTLFIRGVTPCPGSVSLDSTNMNSPPLVLIIIAACSISTLLTLTFFLVIVPKVKRCSKRRRRTSSHHVPNNNNVYEVMTKQAFRPAPEQSSSGTCDSA